MAIFYIGSGINQNDSSRYSIVNLKQNEQANEQADEQADEQANEQADEYIITTLDLYFNYIYNIGPKKFKNISEDDKTAIINIMSKLEIYFERDLWKILPEDKLLDLKFQYWCIKEIYFSPYRAFLYSLTRDRFIFRFLKAKKYCNLDNPYKFMNYFIKCVQEDFYKNKKDDETRNVNNE